MVGANCLVRMTDAAVFCYGFPVPGINIPGVKLQGFLIAADGHFIAAKLPEAPADGMTKV